LAEEEDLADEYPTKNYPTKQTWSTCSKFEAALLQLPEAALLQLPEAALPQQTDAALLQLPEAALPQFTALLQSQPS